MPMMPNPSRPSKSDARLLAHRVVQTKLSPEQQLDAVRKTEAQAEQRMRLGIKLFEAAENRLIAQKHSMAELRASQQAMQEQLNAEIQRVAAEQDDQINRLESRIVQVVKATEDRINGLERAWQASETRLNRLMSQVQSLLEKMEPVAEPTAPPAPAPTASPAASCTVSSQASALENDIANNSQNAVYTEVTNTSPPAAATGPSVAKSQEDAWGNVYRRALLCLSESASAPASEPDASTQQPPRAGH